MDLLFTATIVALLMFILGYQIGATAIEKNMHKIIVEHGCGAYDSETAEFYFLYGEEDNNSTVVPQ